MFLNTGKNYYKKGINLAFSPPQEEKITINGLLSSSEVKCNMFMSSLLTDLECYKNGTCILVGILPRSDLLKSFLDSLL